MSKFIKLSELKEEKLKEKEMSEVKGGYTMALMYGVLPTLKDLPF